MCCSVQMFTLCLHQKLNMATANIIRYKQKVNSNGTSPIILQLIHQRKIKRISLGSLYDCTSDQWNEAANEYNRKFPEYKAKNVILLKYKTSANNIIENFAKIGKPFSFMAFETIFRGGSKNTPTLFELFEERISEMKAKSQLSNAEVYDSTKRVLKHFKPKDNVALVDVNYKFLTDFEIFLTKRGSNGGGIINHMKTLRALINEAIRREYIMREQYPFKNLFNNNGYSFAHIKSDARPRALSKADIDKFKNFPYTEYPKLNFAYKIFMFIYYSRGMNTHDIATLKHKDIYDGRIHYIRAKTGKHFSIQLTESLKGILLEFYTEGSEYAFPILNDFHKTPQQIRDRIRKKARQINEGIKKIATILEIDVHLTSYVARHSFAMTLKRNGVSEDKISETFDHSDSKTIRAYLNKFEDSEIDELDKLL